MSTKRVAGIERIVEHPPELESATRCLELRDVGSHATSVASSLSARELEQLGAVVEPSRAASACARRRRALLFLAELLRALRLSQTFGSSSSRSTVRERADFTSKSKIPPKLRRRDPSILERVADGVDVFGFHGDRLQSICRMRRLSERSRAARALARTARRARHRLSAPRRFRMPMPLFFVNKERRRRRASVPGDTPLLWILRDS
jgi:hypothetical protein